MSAESPFALPKLLAFAEAQPEGKTYRYEMHKCFLAHYVKSVGGGVDPMKGGYSFDWCAYRDGEEEQGNYGWGRTEEAAIAELLVIEMEATP